MDGILRDKSLANSNRPTLPRMTFYSLVMVGVLENVEAERCAPRPLRAPPQRHRLSDQVLITTNDACCRPYCLRLHSTLPNRPRGLGAGNRRALLQRHLRHVATAPRTVLAGAGAALHLWVRCEAFAVARARLAQACASLADHRMLRRAPQQRVGGRLAHLGTVQQERQVGHRIVPPSLFRAVPSLLKAHRVRLQAAVDTLLNRHLPAAHVGIAPAC